MSRQNILLVLLALVVIAITAYWFTNQATPQLTNEPLATTTESVPEAPVESVERKNEMFGLSFDPSIIIAGDTVGKFKVLQASFRSGIPSYPYDTYTIRFQGPVSIQGKFNYGGDMCGPTILIPTSTAATLPHIASEEMGSAGFFLRYTPEEMTSQDSGGYITRSGTRINDGDTVEVTSDSFSLIYEAKDCGGNSMRITSIKKVSN